MSDHNPYDLWEEYTHFWILVISWANAGKTMLLQRVCNTIEDPCIYDDDKNFWWVFIDMKMNSDSDIFN